MKRLDLFNSVLSLPAFGTLPVLGAALVTCAMTLSSPALAADKGKHAADDHDAVPGTTVPESKNQIIRLTDDGLEPHELTMKREDSIIFFLNDTTDALATISVDFGKKTTHCATTNLKIGEDGVISSIKPMQRKEFASICVHDAGTYPLKVYGLKKDPHGVVGSINVQ